MPIYQNRMGTNSWILIFFHILRFSDSSIFGSERVKLIFEPKGVISNPAWEGIIGKISKNQQVATLPYFSTKNATLPYFSTKNFGENHKGGPLCKFSTFGRLGGDHPRDPPL